MNEQAHLNLLYQVGELASLVTRSEGVGSFLQSAVEMVALHLRADVCSIYLYDEGADAPVAAGGRYDGLLGHFGLDVPSVGFSIMLRRLQSRLKPHQLPELPTCSSAGTGSFRERVARARSLRNAGKVVRL